MRIAFITLGCKTNQFETQAMELLAREAGLEVTDPDREADIYIVNSCAVTANAGKKSRQEMRAARKRNPAATVAACGCYTRLASDELLESGDADLISDNRDHRAFLDAVLEKARGALFTEKECFELLPAGNLAGRTRALLKIEDGCNNFCTYCVIPYLRGRVRSAAPDYLLSEAGRLSEEGFREIVLTGIEIASYGTDLPGKPSLGSLISSLCRIAPASRFRLGSLEPRTVTEEFCSLLAPLGNLCPHFHLSLQSGCDKTLKAMNRHYDTALFREVVARLRRYFPACAITTDIITGFPGETEEDFQATLHFAEEMRFDKVHVFPFSARKGTRAVRLPDQVLRETREERGRILNRVCTAIAAEALKNHIGRQYRVLFETVEADGRFLGYTENYHPFKASGTDLAGRLLPVRVEGIEGEALVGSVLDTEESGSFDL